MKSKTLSMFSLGLAFLLVLLSTFGCQSSQPKPAGQDGTQLAAEGQFDQSLEELKSSLLTTANQWALEPASPGKYRQTFDSLYYRKFLDRGSQQKPQEKLEKILGPWRQVWSTFENPNPAPLPEDPQNVYQVILESGRALNIGQRSLPNGKPVISMIGIDIKTRVEQKTESGSDKDARSIVDVEFKNVFALEGGIEEYKKNLTDFALKVLDGKLGNKVPSGNFPRGPIGAKGYLESIYVDDDIRIDIGSNPFTGGLDYYVLERVKN